MADDSKRKAASKAVKTAQKQFERDSKAAREARRKAFAKAQRDGLSLREIGELVGLITRASARSSEAIESQAVEFFSTPAPAC